MNKPNLVKIWILINGFTEPGSLMMQILYAHEQRETIQENNTPDIEFALWGVSILLGRCNAVVGCALRAVP